MSKLLRVGGQDPKREARGIKVTDDGRIIVNDTSQEGMAIGNIVYPSRDSQELKTVMGLKVFNYNPYNKPRSDLSSIEFKNGLVVTSTRGYIRTYDSSLNELAAFEVQSDSIPRSVKICALTDGKVAYIGANLKLNVSDMRGNSTFIESVPNMGASPASGNIYYPLKSNKSGSKFVYAGTGKIKMYDSDGIELWAVSFGGASLAPSGEELRTMNMAFSSDEKKLAIVARSSSSSLFYIIDAATGDVLARQEMAASSPLPVYEHDGMFHFRYSVSVDSIGNLSATDKYGPTLPASSCVAKVDDGVVYSSTAGGITCEDFEGNLRFEIENAGIIKDTGNYPTSALAADEAGHIYVLNEAGLFKLSTELVVKGYRL